jgi:hypothetical protein
MSPHLWQRSGGYLMPEFDMAAIKEVVDHLGACRPPGQRAVRARV